MIILKKSVVEKMRLGESPGKILGKVSFAVKNDLTFRSGGENKVGKLKRFSLQPFP